MFDYFLRYILRYIIFYVIYHNYILILKKIRSFDFFFLLVSLLCRYIKLCILALHINYKVYNDKE